MSTTDSPFDQFYRRHHRPILAYCLRRTSREEAYEAANEVFTVAWRRSADVPAGNQALPWLYGVARRVLAHQRRSTTRFTRVTQRAAMMPNPAPPIKSFAVSKDNVSSVADLSVKLIRITFPQ